MIQLSQVYKRSIQPVALHLLTVGAISASTVLLGLVPDLAAASGSSGFSSAAMAQAVSDAEIRGYAQSVLEIEDLRRNAYQEIQSQMPSGQQLPNISCHQRDSINGLNRQARQVAISYCNASVQVVERFNLSIEDFNRIHAAQQSDRALADKVRRELIRLRSN
ncbi:MAG: DUF4168 domain-containing protein [Kaiparowitsia implicata GSE-PSE-MK54-09C]|jgi:hypothetical protein|nr:DUF4168 domain-containing protein [Kaiparowitsia implicata GSE-PSE-MK54-09C]